MDIRLIGVIKGDTKDIIGYRLLDISTGSVRDVSVENVKSVIASGKAEIRGLKLRGESLAGSNGSIDRYPVIVNGVISGKSPLTIIAKYETDGDTTGYSVADYTGKVVKATVDDVIKYSKIHGISNGAVKNLGDKMFISPIVGEYDKIKIKVDKSALEELEKTIWTREDFVRYMNKNNYEYMFDNVWDREEILFKCNEAKLLKYPLGITEINYHFIDGKSEVETLILSPSIEDTGISFIEHAPKLKRVVLQEGMTRIRLHGLKGRGGALGNSITEIVFPSTLEELRFGISELDSLTKIDLGHTKVVSCIQIGNRLISLKKVILPESLMVLEESFMYATELTSVKIPASITKLTEGSFQETGVKVVDLSHCKQLKRIGKGIFQRCANLTKVVIPDSVTEIGEDAFGGCKKLTDVRLSSELTKIDSFAFSGCKIGRFVVNNKLKSIGIGVFSDSTTLELDDSNTVVKSHFIKGDGYAKVILPDTITKIGANAFERNSGMEEINMPPNLESIAECAFYSCRRLEEIELFNCTKLKSIGASAFEYCTGIKRLILPEGLETIGDNCFERCYKLKYAVLPKTLQKIGKRAFYGCGSDCSQSTTFYVYNKSVGLSYCKKNKLRHIIINDLDDVLAIEEVDREIDKTKKMKLDMVLAGDTTHIELQDEPYSKYADVLYRIYGYLNSKYSEGAVNLELNRDKLISFPLEKVEILNNYVSTIKNEDTLNTNYSKDNLANRFISLTNYITKILDLNPAPFTTNGIKYLERASSCEYRTIYSDNCSSIVVLEVGDSKYAKVKSLVVVVIIDDTIVFVSALDDTQKVSMFTGERLISYDIKESVSTLFKVADKICVYYYMYKDRNIISGAPLPEYIHDVIVNSINSQLVVLTHETFNGLTLNGDKNIAIDLYCINTSKVITVQSTLKSSYINGGALHDIPITINDIDSFLVTDIRDINSLSKETEARLKNWIDSEDTRRLFERESYGDKYMEKLVSLPGAYDTDTCYEWDVAQILNSMNVNNVEDLTIDLFKAIVDTALYTQTRSSFVDICKKNNLQKTTILEDSKYALVELSRPYNVASRKLPNGRSLTVVGLIDTTADGKASQYFYYSNKSLKRNIDMLRSMVVTGEFPIGISDNVIDHPTFKSEFCIIQRQSGISEAHDMFMSTSIAINHNNGQVYLMGTIHGENERHYTMLRFKTLEGALKHCNWMNADEKVGVEHKYFRTRLYILDELYRIDTGIYKKKAKHEFIKLREEIMSGIPNGYYVPYCSIDLLDDVARQEQ